MIKILFVRSDSATLPEIDAYVHYLQDKKQKKQIKPISLDINGAVEKADVVWEFKGFGGYRNRDKFLVHEYASLSTPSFPKLKNFFKRRLNPKPDLRVFLNQKVKDDMRFKDDVPYVFRDMGVSDIFFDVVHPEKKYEFVYVGEVSTARDMDKFLKTFSQNPPGRLLLIGNYDKKLYDKYSSDKIIFKGKVSLEEVPGLVTQATYALNIIPNKYPYNIQTSTKLLEYVTLGMKVITTDYQWVREFEKKHDISFYKINDKDYKIDLEDLNKHDFDYSVDMREYKWAKVIKNSNVFDKIEEIMRMK